MGRLVAVVRELQVDAAGLLAEGGHLRVERLEGFVEITTGIVVVDLLICCGKRLWDLTIFNLALTLP